MFISKKSNGIYYIFYKGENGKRNSISCKTKRKADANIFFSNFKDEMNKRNKNPLIEIKISSFFDEYVKINKYRYSDNTILSIKSFRNSLINYFSDITINKITKIAFENYLAERLQKVTSQVIRRELSYLSVVFRWGTERNYIKDNFVKKLKKPKVIEKQPIFFSENNFNELVKFIDEPDIYDIVKFAVNTGLRQGELISLTWNQIDLKERVLILTNQSNTTKSKKVRTIYLNLSALKILQYRELNKCSELVFTFKNMKFDRFYLSHKFKYYVKKAKLNPSLNFHSLRHTFASWLVLNDVPILTVSKLLGHSSLSVTTIYSHLTGDHLTGAINILDKIPLN